MFDLEEQPPPPPRRPPVGPGKQSFSALLQELAAQEGPERISLGDLLAALQDRAFGALLLVFAFPNILPSPPGLAGVLGLPLLVLTTLMVLGRKPWLPGFIARRSLSRDAFASVVARGAPWIARAESLLRPRLRFAAHPLAERGLGLVCLFLTLLLMLPVPFANMMPSLAICLIGLGLLGRDGVWVLIGLLASVAATGWVGGLGYAALKSAIFVVVNAF